MAVPHTVREAMRHACQGSADTVDGQRAFLAGVAFAVFHLNDGAESERLQDEIEAALGQMLVAAGHA